jgi:membrane-bound serine protease (ClpP class)
VIGALMLVDTEVPELSVSWQFVLPIALASALLLGTLGTLALRARARPRRTGREALLGARVVALEDIALEGWVEVSGERWRARTAAPLGQGKVARVTGIDGLLLSVQPEREEQA